MNCPKCGAAMEIVAFQSVEVDRCTRCHGLWFDESEHRRLRELAGSEAIDIGAAQVQATDVPRPDLPCPACGATLVHTMDPLESAAWYEACPQCEGVFFDAGEFKDFKRAKFAEFLRGLGAT